TKSYADEIGVQRELWSNSVKGELMLHDFDVDVDREVERLFKENPPRRGELCENPVTGGRIVGGEGGPDSTRVQKAEAKRALSARKHFAESGPPEAQPLPLTAQEIEQRKYLTLTKTGERDVLSYIVSRYACSLQQADWDFTKVPSFEDIAAGVL